MRKFKEKTLKGLTVYMCFGSYGGFSLKFRRHSHVPVRLSLGWFSITVLNWDLENFFEKIVQDGTQMQSILNRYKKETYLGR